MKKIYLLMAILIFSTSIMLSCKDKEKTNDSEVTQTQEETPQQLIDLEENIQRVFIELAKPETTVDKEDNKEGEENESSSNESEEKQQDDNSEKQSTNQDNQEDSSEEDENNKEAENESEQKKTDIFIILAPTIDEIHTEWNNFIPELSKKNSDANLTKNFSTALNDLTNAILAKDKKGSLYAANYLYSFIPKFYNLYPDNQNELLIKDMKFYVRNVMLYSVQDNNWDSALADISNLMMQWDSFKTIVNSQQSTNESSKNSLEKDEDIIIQIEYAYTELKEAVDQNNANIAEIKATIALTLIDEYEKKLLKQKEDLKSEED